MRYVADRVANQNVREGNGRELATLEPMNSRGVDGNGLLSTDIRAVLEVSVLTLLFGLQVQSSKTTKVLLDHSFVDRSTSANTFTVIVCNPTSD